MPQPNRLRGAFEAAVWAEIPSHCRGSLRRYIEDHVPTGEFLQAVISNDLRGACCKADDINRHALYSYVFILYNYAPHQCWGSPEAYVAWIAARPAAPDPDHLRDVQLDRKLGVGSDDDKSEPDCPCGDPDCWRPWGHAHELDTLD